VVQRAGAVSLDRALPWAIAGEQPQSCLIPRKLGISTLGVVGGIQQYRQYRISFFNFRTNSYREFPIREFISRFLDAATKGEQLFSIECEFKFIRAGLEGFHDWNSNQISSDNRVPVIDQSVALVTIIVMVDREHVVIELSKMPSRSSNIISPFLRNFGWCQ
jgi:hypothetical protein